jgi:four helix bundle protein
MTITSYRDLQVWQDAMKLAEVCYRMTALLPPDELFGLNTQIKRSAVSIPSNIAEGYGRGSAASYAHHLKIARGSLRELETQLLLMTRIELAREEQIQPALGLCDEVGRKLHGLIRSLNVD